MPAPAGRVGLVEASLEVREGEIVGIAGVSGNGQAALAALISGTARADAGSGRRCSARRCRRSPAGRGPTPASRRIPEDRHHDGVVGSLTVAENLDHRDLGDPDVQRWGFLRFRRHQEPRAGRDRGLRHPLPGPDAPIRLLSGGNIQKLILARVLGREPRLVLANQPTRGLDVGAAAEVHRRLLEARARGAGVILLISEDLDELFALSDRIAVITAGASRRGAGREASPWSGSAC